MDNEKKLKRTIGIILLIGLIWIWQNYKTINNLKEENSVLEHTNSTLEYRLSDYQSSLEEANNNIEDANSQIEDAQGYAWESYNDMGETLENLSTVETVDEP